MNLSQIQKSGYSNEDIKILAAIFSVNLDEFEDCLEQSNPKEIVALLHKLKGGLNLMMDAELAKNVELLENNAEKNSKSNLIVEIYELIKLSRLHLKELLNLI